MHVINYFSPNGLGILELSVSTAVLVILATAILYVIYILFRPMNRIRDLCDIGYEEHTRLDKYGRTRRQVANDVRRRKKIGEIPPIYPNGWFTLCESDDVKNGEVRAVDALGENFIVFRTESGVACIMDAYCPHLGAHLGIGGRVVGDCVECPFHGWKFRGQDGQCTSIPYTTGKLPQFARVKTWPCDEINGFIFVWYHAEQEEPSWKIPSIPEISSKKWYYRGRSEYKVNAHIQEIPENGSDIAHLHCLHGPSILYGSDLNTTLQGKRENGIAPFLQHRWTVQWQSDAKEKHVAFSYLTHQMCFFDKFTFISVDVEAKQIGPGVVHLTFDSSFGRCVLIETVTPLEGMVQRVLHRLYAPSSMIAPLANFFIWGEAVMFERDVVVWNNKTFIKKPILVSEDRAITQFRRWFYQFYSENSPRFTFDGGNKNQVSNW